MLLLNSSQVDRISFTRLIAWSKQAQTNANSLVGASCPLRSFVPTAVNHPPSNAGINTDDTRHLQRRNASAIISSSYPNLQSWQPILSLAMVVALPPRLNFAFR